MSLGDANSLSLLEAKNLAHEYNTKISNGISPKEQEQNIKLNKYADSKGLNFAELCEKWIETSKANRNYARSTINYWKLCLGYLTDVLGNMSPDGIESYALLSVLEGIQEHAPVVGKDARGYASKVFNFGIREAYANNPAQILQGELQPLIQ